MATEVKIRVIFEGQAIKKPAGMLEIFYYLDVGSGNLELYVYFYSHIKINQAVYLRCMYFTTLTVIRKF